MDFTQRALADLPRDRLLREAIRAHEALMRYGKHDPDCPMGDVDNQRGPCDCGLDAASYSPFLVERTGETL